MLKYVIVKKKKDFKLVYYHRVSTQKRVLWSYQMYAKIFDTKENAEIALSHIQKDKTSKYGILNITIGKNNTFQVEGVSGF